MILKKGRVVVDGSLHCRSFRCGVGIGSIRQRINHIFVALVAIKVCRIIAGKRLAAVMTLETIEPGSRPVFERGYAVHLLSLSVARLHFVAFTAAFASVVCVTENDLWTILRRERSYVVCELVANAAGIIFILGLMANITSCVGLKTCGDGFTSS